MTQPPLPSFYDISQVFTPHAPVNEKDLFAGRTGQIRRLIDVLSQRGLHAVMFGERGVGKTSLARVFSKFLETDTTSIVVIHTSCDSSDSFDSLWRKALGEVTVRVQTQPISFQEQPPVLHASRLSDQLSNEPVTSNHVRRFLEVGAQTLLIIILDEFDRLPKPVAHEVSDTIKLLSDSASSATLVLVGVADSVTDLIEGHASVERALIQIHLPRMSAQEIGQLVQNGAGKIGMSASSDAIHRIVNLAQGLPYYAHALARYAAKEAVDTGSRNLQRRHVDTALQRALQDIQHSIKSDYTTAVSSPRSENLFALVLLACAFAAQDDLGYFAPSAVRSPLSILRNKKVEIPSFARHLYEFAGDSRGRVLERTGRPRAYRYRFRNPLVQPYVIMRGLADGLLPEKVLEKLSGSASST